MPEMKEKITNRTKIVATIGPSSSSKEILEQLIRAGVNVCRINGSHGNHELQKEIITTVREINNEKGLHVAILYDLQGPKLRIGEVLNSEILLNDGEELTLTTSKDHTGVREIFVQYPSICQDVQPGETILVDDGKIALKVMEVVGNEKVITQVIHGGVLSSRKGINLPDTKISLPSLTEKDLADLQFALDHNVEWIGLSFVRSASDIISLKKIIADRNKQAKVIAKIEKPEALIDITAIIEETDGLMVARGDLGVEMPMEQVPLIQKMLVASCIEASKPVIIATQMMESMITNFRPTRAEVNDVANALLDGADALMLSAETSVGKYPVEVIEAMYKIIHLSETKMEIYYRDKRPEQHTDSFVSDTICYNACMMAKHADAVCISVMTHSGYSAFRIASQRPKASIMVFTDNKSLLNMLSLVWGVQGFYYDKYVSTDVTISDIKAFLRQQQFVKTKDLVIHVASTPLHEKGTTNTIKLNLIE